MAFVTIILQIILRELIYLLKKFIGSFVFPHDISKTGAARITKLSKDMVHHESWKPVYFGVQNVKGQGHQVQSENRPRQVPVSDTLYPIRTSISTSLHLEPL